MFLIIKENRKKKRIQVESQLHLTFHLGKRENGKKQLIHFAFTRILLRKFVPIRNFSPL